MRGDEAWSTPIARELLNMIHRGQYRIAIERQELADLLGARVGTVLSVNLLSRVLRRICPSDYPHMVRTGRVAEGRRYLYILPQPEDFLAHTETWYRPPAPVDTMDV